ncbi:hypothetical protein NMY22_g4568 [Coprinellus aureogranulatus]|nr:hypothetical protein NMY22_g4568 [Coprinellus aureogranulatus]
MMENPALWTNIDVDLYRLSGDEAAADQQIAGLQFCVRLAGGLSRSLTLFKFNRPSIDISVLTRPKQTIVNSRKFAEAVLSAGSWKSIGIPTTIGKEFLRFLFDHSPSILSAAWKDLESLFLIDVVNGQVSDHATLSFSSTTFPKLQDVSLAGRGQNLFPEWNLPWGQLRVLSLNSFEGMSHQLEVLTRCTRLEVCALRPSVARQGHVLLTPFFALPQQSLPITLASLRDLDFSFTTVDTTAASLLEGLTLPNLRHLSLAGKTTACPPLDDTISAMVRLVHRSQSLIDTLTISVAYPGPQDESTIANIITLVAPSLSSLRVEGSYMRCAFLPRDLSFPTLNDVRIVNYGREKHLSATSVTRTRGSLRPLDTVRSRAFMTPPPGQDRASVSGSHAWSGPDLCPRPDSSPLCNSENRSRRDRVGKRPASVIADAKADATPEEVPRLPLKEVGEEGRSSKGGKM